MLIANWLLLWPRPFPIYGSNETVWDAIIDSELIKWTVQFYNNEGQVIKTAKIGHQSQLKMKRQ